jgi:UDP-N-acetylmuramyl pentapeptide phosphotransferase/UDP-N-acetylglucosamine-1-phosphate transferase
VPRPAPPCGQDDGGGAVSDRHGPRSAAVGTVARILGITVVAALLYVAVPARRGQEGVGWELLVAMAALLVVVGLEVRAIVRSHHPALRGVEAVVVAVPMLLLPFTTAYLQTAAADPRAFTEPLDRLDAFYFCMTVFATVGFGDIAPVSSTARALVTGQMVLDMVFIGFVARVLVGAVQRRRASLESSPTLPDPAGSDVERPT